MKDEIEDGDENIRNAVTKAARMKTQSGVHLSADAEADISNMLQNLGAPPTRPRSPRDIMEANRDFIRIALDAGWTAAGICEKLKAFDVNIKASTFNVYWRQIQALPLQAPRLASPERFSNPPEDEGLAQRSIKSVVSTKRVPAPIEEKGGELTKKMAEESGFEQLGLFEAGSPAVE